MITFISGKVAAIGERTVSVDVHGVGYEAYVTHDALSRLVAGAEATLYTHFNVREDAQELYGFLQASERDFFRLLLGVSGIGPKSALNILDSATPDEIRQAVSAQDAALLIKVNGIGKKTAERLVTELKDKLDVMVAGEGAVGDEAAFIEAITGLGYSLAEAREALKQVGRAGTLAERVKQGIKLLSKR